MLLGQSAPLYPGAWPRRQAREQFLQRWDLLEVLGRTFRIVIVVNRVEAAHRDQDPTGAGTCGSVLINARCRQGSARRQQGIDMLGQDIGRHGGSVRDRGAGCHAIRKIGEGHGVAAGPG